MNREKDVKVQEITSTPNKIDLTDGSYVLWDRRDSFYRVAYFSRNDKKGSDLEQTIALAMKKPVHNFRVKQVFDYISKTPEYAEASS